MSVLLHDRLSVFPCEPLWSRDRVRYSPIGDYQMDYCHNCSTVALRIFCRVWRLEGPAYGLNSLPRFVVDLLCSLSWNRSADDRGNSERKCAEDYNNTITLFFKTAISILVISNHNSFRVLFDKIASVYFIWKMYLYFSIGNGQPQGTSTVPIYWHIFVSYWVWGYWTYFVALFGLQLSGLIAVQT